MLRKLREWFVNWLLRGVHLREVTFGKKTITLTDKINFSTSIATSTGGDIGMDLSTGRPTFRQGGTGTVHNRACAHTADIGGDDFDWTISGADQFFALSGNVGIGTDSPERKLTIANSTGTPTGVDANTAVLVKNDGNVGVTISCGSSHIGFIHMGDAANAAEVVAIQYIAPTQHLEQGGMGNLGWRFDVSGGNIGIGRTSGGNDFEVEGTASKTAAGNWLANSDARIKERVQGIEGALGTIDRLRPVRFRYTDFHRRSHPSIEDRDHAGFIAQEYRKVFRDEVKMNDESLLEMSHHAALVTAASAVQELDVLAHKQRREIEGLISIKGNAHGDGI